MKIFSLIIVCLCIIASVSFLSACNIKTQSPIKYQRKLEKYFSSEKKASSADRMIDLSEGPRQRYDANFGPKDLNFDIKIVNPY